MTKKIILFVSILALPFSWARALPVTQAEQAALTPDEVLELLIAGNARYVAAEPEESDYLASRKAAVSGQYPMAYVLSCVDSRVPVEAVFDQGIGDIFVGRNAGNVDTTAQLGSMEFAAAVAGVKVVMVLGHEACGAVKGACDHVKLGNLTQLLSEIEPAVQKGGEGYLGEKNSGNADFVKRVTELNVEQTIADIRYRSAVLSELEASGKLKIVGAYYSLEDGSVQLLD